ncbi:hypothetical protein [uncultured Methanobrevibacter sp.]|uniref:hypothetical protein n=1 Tax=uncultured Methanobrevibacter sp. TaxID=253161 RepID=UPI003441EEFB
MHEKNWQDIIHEYCEELRQEGRDEGIYEAKIKTINEIKTLEKEGKNLTEIINILTNNTNKSMKK